MTGPCDRTSESITHVANDVDSWIVLSHIHPVSSGQGREIREGDVVAVGMDRLQRCYDPLVDICPAVIK